ncbi:MAG TPA: DUF1295 domain-containing protein [Nevskiaceae bacterium]|nr:DUF1295 domain-containing protein [Nevskiaceae bacterium]
MGKTAILLVATLIAVPLLAYLDTPMSAFQWNMIGTVTLLMLCFALACFVTGEITGNVSQVDKLWSITPVIYAWVMAAKSGMDGRMLLMALVATVWGARLTYNFSRHGGYSWKFWTGHEDYRWAEVRKMPEFSSPMAWKVFHFGFICLYQNALLLLITLPMVKCASGASTLSGLDFLLALIFLALVALETWADQEQWNFQAEKKRRLAAGEPLTGRYESGFIHDGLWAYSRHPNYLAEQSIWVVFYLFSVSAVGFNWTVAGCLLLILLFQGSSNMSEGLQAKKYPRYADYQSRVPRFIPRFR